MNQKAKEKKNGLFSHLDQIENDYDDEHRMHACMHACIVNIQILRFFHCRMFVSAVLLLLLHNNIKTLEIICLCVYWGGR